MGTRNVDIRWQRGNARHEAVVRNESRTIFGHVVGGFIQHARAQLGAVPREVSIPRGTLRKPCDPP